MQTQLKLAPNVDNKTTLVSGFVDEEENEGASIAAVIAVGRERLMCTGYVAGVDGIRYAEYALGTQPPNSPTISNYDR